MGVGLRLLQRRRSLCFSYLGATRVTAGLGREIQLILSMIWMENPALIERAFAAEAGNLQRFFRLKGGGNKGCYTETPLKRFLCAIWIDPARSTRWENALVELGQVPVARDAYARLYAMESLTGKSFAPFSSCGRSWALRQARSTMRSSWIASRTWEGRPKAED